MAATYSSGSTVVFKQIIEATYGALPPTPTMKQLRVKPSKITLKKDTYTTDEVRSDRGISDLRHGMRKVEGTLEGDLMMNDWDDFILAAIQGAAWVNKNTRLGTNLSSFCIEQGFTDINQFRLFKGCSVSKLKLSVKPGAMVGISVDFIGQDATTGVVTNANATTAPGTSAPFSFASGSIQEGGSAIAYITGVDFELDNGLGQVGVVGSNLSPAIFNGRSSLKGTVTALFKDQVMLNKFLNETESSISMVLIDPSGASHTIFIPRIKYTGGDIAPPKDGATIITLPFEGLLAPLIANAACTSLAISAAAPTTTPLTATFTKVGGTSFITQGFAPGMLLTADNTITTPGNRGDWLISAVAADIITVVVPVGSTMVVQAAGAFGNGAGALSVQPTNIVWSKS